MTRRPLPSTGSLGPVPPLHRYYEALRLPAALPPRFVSFAWRYHGCARRFAPTGCGRPRLWAWTLGHPEPSRDLTAETSGSPRFLGGPPCVHALRSDPGGPLDARPLRRRDVAFRSPHDVGSPIRSFEAQLPRPAHSLSTLRRRGLPRHHARLASGWWPTLAGWDSDPLGPLRRVSGSVYCIPSSLPRLRLAQGASPRRRCRSGSPRPPAARFSAEMCVRGWADAPGSSNPTPTGRPPLACRNLHAAFRHLPRIDRFIWKKERAWPRSPNGARACSPGSKREGAKTPGKGRKKSSSPEGATAAWPIRRTRPTTTDRNPTVLIGSGSVCRGTADGPALRSLTPRPPLPDGRGEELHLSLAVLPLSGYGEGAGG